MNEILGPKYSVDNYAFSIQYLHQTGHVSMRNPHSHPSFEIYYVFDGGRVFFINETVYTAHKGDMIIVCPNDVHQTTSSDALKCERILINFNESFLEAELSACKVPLLNQFSDTPLIRFPVDTQAVIEELLRKLLSECEKQKAAYETQARSLLTQLLIYTYRRATDQNQVTSSYQHPMHKKITEIAGYLNEHFHQNVTLREVSGLFYISPSYLSRIFKKITGFQFKEYIHHIRVREAKRLLRETKDPISLVAEKAGFEHPSNFNVTFKKITGVTPGYYRKSYR